MYIWRIFTNLNVVLHGFFQVRNGPLWIKFCENKFISHEILFFYLKTLKIYPEFCEFSIIFSAKKCFPKQGAKNHIAILMKPFLISFQFQLLWSTDPPQIRPDGTYPQAVELFPCFKDKWNTKEVFFNFLFCKL